MTGAELSKQLTKRGRDIASCEVFIDTSKSRKSIAEVVYDEENKYILLIPEAESKPYRKFKGERKR